MDDLFQALGVEVVVSPPTNKAILDQGTKSVVDETCLPVKVFLVMRQLLLIKMLIFYLFLV